jgi:tetratricopeptide (TPR) repeat protein
LLPALRARALAAAGRTEAAEAGFVAALCDAGRRELPAVVDQLVAAYGAQSAASKLAGWAHHRAGDPQVRLLLAELRREAGDLDGAARACRAAIGLEKSAPARARIWHRLGEVLHAMCEVADARDAYLAAVRLAPDAVASLNNLAYLYVDDLGDAARARPYAKRAAELAPTEAHVQDTYGWVLARLGERGEARRRLESAAALAPASPTVRYHLGWLYEQSGALAAALEQYRRADALAGEAGGLRPRISEALARVGRMHKAGNGE